MPVPSVITDLSTTATSNSPAGSDNVFPDLDNYLRALSAFLASIRDNSGNGWTSPYLTAANPSYTGTLTGGTGVVNLGSNQFLKDAAGNVGIGVVPTAWRSGAKALQIGGFASLNTQQNGTVTLAFGAYESGSNIFSYLTTGDAPTAYSQISGQHRWLSAASGTAGNTISFTQSMTLDESGVLSIGTPLAENSVGVFALPAGELRVKDITQNGTSQISIYNTNVTSDVEQFFAAMNGSDVDLGNRRTDAGVLKLFTANQERARIDFAGNLLITSTGGLGYGTGSGGAVTQITSRTTGVTLNKTNGAITLVSAAGTATWQSFTVTNSTVAATDTVIVSQKSGTDLNQIFVTAVAAGSFRISFATTGGTTTEQPVFNFAVIKAVTA